MRSDRFDTRLLKGLANECNVLALLQTLPGVDLIGTAVLLVVIGTTWRPSAAAIS